MSGTFETQQRRWYVWSRMEAGEMAGGEVRKAKRDRTKGLLGGWQDTGLWRVPSSGMAAMLRMVC